MIDSNEAITRKSLIDPALEKAGWNVTDSSRVGLEIPVDSTDKTDWGKIEAKIRETHKIPEIQLPAGISDYVLYRPNGEIIGVVEAKRTSFDPRMAQAQTEFYVKEIQKKQGWPPFAFMTNGHEIYFLAGDTNKRQVYGFFSEDDLENLLYIRNNKTPLSEALANTDIAGRPYQQEAIRRLCETFDKGKRRALLVMATGTGKTRTTMGLIDVFLRTNQARRILFVADRDALVKQALNDGFKKYIPNEPQTRIHTSFIDKTKRLYVSTLQTMSNCFEQFTPAFFDIIIFDEVHRSIFNKWNEVLDYFDGRIIGLTATPTALIDRNTFLEFGCDNQTPAFLYPYEQAVDEKYLVDFDLWKAQTHFQRKGIRGIDLSEEERNILIEQGIDPDGIDYSGSDIEKKVSNKDTLRKQWEEVWEKTQKDASGQLPGKTIVFAMTQEHALRLADVFEEMYPQFPGLAKVITSNSDYQGVLVEEFKKEDWPRIAISVDMLETGVDVPEVVNLVFMRPVQSGIKLWQMIGRGTRNHETCKFLNRLPNGHKDHFLIIDFWENDFKKAPTAIANEGLPILVTLFNTRLKLLERFLKHKSPFAERTIEDLRAQIKQIPVESFSVRKVYHEVEIAWAYSFWEYLTADKIEFLRLKVGPLLRYSVCRDVAAATFTSKMERLKLQILTNQDTTETAKSVAEDVSRLPSFVFEKPTCEKAAKQCFSQDLHRAKPEEINSIIDALAEQMKYRRKEEGFLTLDLLDFIETGGYILLFGGAESVYVKEYRQRVEQRILDIVASHPVITAIEHGEVVNDTQLLDLERTLRYELTKPGIELTQDNIKKAYGFKTGSFLELARRLLDIDGLPAYEDIVRHQFQTYIGSHTFIADQLRFLRAVLNVFLEKRKLSLPDLYEAPLNAFGQNAVERWFSDEEVKDLLTLTKQLTINGEIHVN